MSDSIRFAGAVGAGILTVTAMAGSITPGLNVSTSFVVGGTDHSQNVSGFSPLDVSDGQSGVSVKARAQVDPGSIPTVGTYVAASGATLDTDATAQATGTVLWTVTSETLPAGMPVTTTFNLHLSGQLRSDSERYATMNVSFAAYDGESEISSFSESASLHGTPAGDWASLYDYAGATFTSFESPALDTTWANADKGRDLTMTMLVGSTYMLSLSMTSTVTSGDFGGALTHSDMYNTASYQYIGATMHDGSGGTIAAPVTMITAVPEPVATMVLGMACSVMLMRRRKR